MEYLFHMDFETTLDITAVLLCPTIHYTLGDFTDTILQPYLASHQRADLV
jgi:hypothetical protein